VFKKKKRLKKTDLIGALERAGGKEKGEWYGSKGRKNSIIADHFWEKEKKGAVGKKKKKGGGGKGTPPKK